MEVEFQGVAMVVGDGGGYGVVLLAEKGECQGWFIFVQRATWNGV